MRLAVENPRAWGPATANDTALGSTSLLEAIFEKAMVVMELKKAAGRFGRLSRSDPWTEVRSELRMGAVGNMICDKPWIRSATFRNYELKSRHGLRHSAS